MKGRGGQAEAMPQNRWQQGQGVTVCCEDGDGPCTAACPSDPPHLGQWGLWEEKRLRCSFIPKRCFLAHIHM